MARHIPPNRWVLGHLVDGGFSTTLALQYFRHTNFNCVVNHRQHYLLNFTITYYVHFTLLDIYQWTTYECYGSKLRFTDSVHTAYHHEYHLDMHHDGRWSHEDISLKESHATRMWVKSWQDDKQDQTSLIPRAMFQTQNWRGRPPFINPMLHKTILCEHYTFDVTFHMALRAHNPDSNNTLWKFNKLTIQVEDLCTSSTLKGVCIWRQKRQKQESRVRDRMSWMLMNTQCNEQSSGWRAPFLFTRRALFAMLVGAFFFHFQV